MIKCDEKFNCTQKWCFVKLYIKFALLWCKLSVNILHIFVKEISLSNIKAPISISTFVVILRCKFNAHFG